MKKAGQYKPITSRAEITEDTSRNEKFNRSFKKQCFINDGKISEPPRK